MNQAQRASLETKKREYEAQRKVSRKHTMAEIALLVLADNPDKWFFTWELMGATKFGWLSHATHATLRVLEQQGKIQKDYIGQFVVYTALDAEQPVAQKPVEEKSYRYSVQTESGVRIFTVRESRLDEFHRTYPKAELLKIKQ